MKRGQRTSVVVCGVGHKGLPLPGLRLCIMPPNVLSAELTFCFLVLSLSLPHSTTRCVRTAGRKIFWQPTHQIYGSCGIVPVLMPLRFLQTLFSAAACFLLLLLMQCRVSVAHVLFLLPCRTFGAVTFGIAALIRQSAYRGTGPFRHSAFSAALSSLPWWATPNAVPLRRQGAEIVSQKPGAAKNARAAFGFPLPSHAKRQKRPLTGQACVKSDLLPVAVKRRPLRQIRFCFLRVLPRLLHAWLSFRTLRGSLQTLLPPRRTPYVNPADSRGLSRDAYRFHGRRRDVASRHLLGGKMLSIRYLRAATRVLRPASLPCWFRFCAVYFCCCSFRNRFARRHGRRILLPLPAAAAPAPKVDTGDTAWLLVSSARRSAFDDTWPRAFLRRHGAGQKRAQYADAIVYRRRPW